MMKKIRRMIVVVLLIGIWMLSCGNQNIDYFSDLDLASVTEPVQMTVATNGQLPEAKDFLSVGLQAQIADANITVTFAQPLSVNAVGMQMAYLNLCAPNGAMKALQVPYTAVYDNIPPVIQGVSDRSALCGEGVALRAGITLTDNCFGEISLEVDSSAVDSTKEGAYPVVYTATDAAGNQTMETTTVYIYAMDVTQEMLMERVDELLSRLVTADMSKEEQCRQIYACIQASIYYVSESDKSDWVREAYQALFVRGYGDCFSYFAAAKALLKRLEIPYVEIQRTGGLTEDTHYWLMVNIAEEGEEARWYHFDPTELRNDGYRHSGCLLTQAQILAYNAVRPNFYAYSAEEYPTACDVIITPTPELGLE